MSTKNLKNFCPTYPLKVALSQKILDNFSTANINIPNHYSRLENLNFPPQTVSNLFKFSAQDSDLEYLCWQWKNSPVSPDLKPPLANDVLLVPKVLSVMRNGEKLQW